MTNKPRKRIKEIQKKLDAIEQAVADHLGSSDNEEFFDLVTWVEELCTSRKPPTDNDADAAILWLGKFNTLLNQIKGSDDTSSSL